MTTAADVKPVDPAPACAVHAPPKHEASERRTRWVVYLTFAMMVAELAFGYWTRSLALTADGWHMGTHVGALGISALAYWYARTRAGQTQFAFGTGKVYALAGYTSAGLMLFVAVEMIFQAVNRFLAPETVRFAEAFPVALIGLVVNLVSAKLLDDGHGHDHPHDHDHAHEHDHNLRAAYLHVVADALTSVLAIAALLAGKFLGWGWVDPVVALVGAVVILRWGVGLVGQCARQLIDLDPSTKLREKVLVALESLGDTKVEDLHLWRVGPKQVVCVVSVSSTQPHTLAQYKEAALAVADIDHLTVEICRRTAA
ncbi:MAG: CDF family Co(II)/Ni(II) efflux transporter DmeF [Myxococcota bacterium]